MIPFALRTERLLLREFTLEDTDFIIELLNTPSWLRYIGDRKVFNKEDAIRYLSNGPMAAYQQNDYGLYMVYHIEDQLPIGMCGLVKRDWLLFADIGFAFLPAYEGKGYAFEASKAVLKDAKERLGLANVGGITVKENFPSIRLLEKLGLIFEKTVQMPAEKELLLLYQKEL